MPKQKSDQVGKVIQFSFRLNREIYEELKGYCERNGIILTRAVNFAVAQFVALKKIEAGRK